MPDVAGYRQTGLIIQRGNRLIQQQNIRLRGQRADQGAALPHAAGQLVRALGGKFPQAVALQQPLHIAAVRRITVVPDLQPQHHVVIDGAPFKQLVALGHKAHAPVGAGCRMAV